MEDFKQLRVWQKAHALTLAVYAVSHTFPREELFGLTGQLRRAAASVGANIAEGCGRRSDAEMKRFVQIARGSANEVEYHLMLAHDLHFVSGVDHEKMLAGVLEVQRMLASIAQKLGAALLARS